MFSKTCEYAIKAILQVASYSSEEKKAGIKELAEELKLPVHSLGKILQHLVKHKILKSVKGPNGGFYLDESTLMIPIIKVVEIIDGDSSFHKCGLGLKQCSDSHPCPIHNEFKPYRDKLKKLLSQKSIRDFSSVIKTGKAFVSNH